MPLDSIPGYIICKLEAEYLAARAIHPEYPHNGLSIIMEELGEAAQAYNDGDYGHTYDELAHTVVTCIRMMEAMQGMKPCTVCTSCGKPLDNLQFMCGKCVVKNRKANKSGVF